MTGSARLYCRGLPKLLYQDDLRISIALLKPHYVRCHAGGKSDSGDVLVLKDAARAEWVDFQKGDQVLKTVLLC